MLRSPVALHSARRFQQRLLVEEPRMVMRALRVDVKGDDVVVGRVGVDRPHEGGARDDHPLAGRRLRAPRLAGWDAVQPTGL